MFQSFLTKQTLHIDFNYLGYFIKPVNKFIYTRANIKQFKTQYTSNIDFMFN